MKRLVVLLLAIAFAIPTSASGGWSNYFGTGTMVNPDPSEGHSGWNYWTNNRVWRNPGHPFYLGYCNGPPGCGVIHYSVYNWDTNPFYFPAYGYNSVFCQWAYWYDGSYSIYPVTCQKYV